MNWKDIIDLHSHIGFYRGTEYTPDDWLRRMDRNGIGRAMVLHFMSGLVERQDFVQANDYVRKAVHSHLDRFIGMCVVSPLHGRFATEEFDRCVENGFSGLKLDPAKHGPFSLRTEVVRELMHKAESHNIIVFIHSDFNSPVCTPYEVVALAASFPNVKMILGHFGLDQERCMLVPSIVRETGNLYLDTSQTPDNPKAIYISPVEEVGIRRLVFGSDAPLISPEVNLKKLEVAMDLYHLRIEDARAILRDNACSLLARVPNVQWDVPNKERFA
jgi:predicted TIM-barrel fold metal-dependent hydrolase